MGAFIVAAVAGAWWFESTTCPIALIFGVPCPGCGLGRATLALITGHPVEALRSYPLVFVVLPALFGFLITIPPARSHRTIAAAAILIAVFGVWIARFAGAFGGPVPVRSAWAATR